MTTLQGDDSKKVSAFRLGHPLVVDGGSPELYQSTDGYSMGFRGSATPPDVIARFSVRPQ